MNSLLMNRTTPERGYAVESCTAACLVSDTQTRQCCGLLPVNLGIDPFSATTPTASLPKRGVGVGGAHGGRCKESMLS